MPRPRPTPRARIRRLAIAAALGAGLVWSYGGSTGSGPGYSPGPESVLPIYSQGVIRALHRFITENEPTMACHLFTDDAARQFATHHGGPDCPTVITALNKRVTDPRYANPEIPRPAMLDGSTYAEFFGCGLTGGATFGPRLGNFTVTQTPVKTWRITKHETEECPAR